MHGMAGRLSSVNCRAGPQLDHCQCLCFAWQALRYLLVVLRGSAGREALEALRPEPRALKRAYTGGRISQVVVTAAGMTPALVCEKHIRASGRKVQARSGAQWLCWLWSQAQLQPIRACRFTSPTIFCAHYYDNSVRHC